MFMNDVDDGDISDGWMDELLSWPPEEAVLTNNFVIDSQNDPKMPENDSFSVEISNPLRLENSAKKCENLVSKNHKRARTPTQNGRKNKSFKGCSTPVPSTRGQVSQTPKNARKKWTELEDYKLNMLVRQYNERGEKPRWSELSGQFPDRTRRSCSQRYALLTRDSNTRLRGWSEDEDRCLTQVIQDIGDPSRVKNVTWNMISSFVPHRDHKQCRYRWINKLNPTINHSPWTTDEEDILMRLVPQLGTKPKKYQEYLPDRTTEQISSMIKKLM